MFPLSDNNPRSKFPFVVAALIAVNLYFYFQELAMGAARTEAFVTLWGLIPVRDFSGPQPHVLNFVSSMFLHGGFFHVAFNMWSLWLFGDNVEETMGPFKFFVFYLLCGVLAALTHSYLEPKSLLPVVGASGAIAGVMGSYLLLHPRAKIRMFTLLIFYPLFFDLPAWAFLILWFVGQLMSGAQTLASVSGTNADVGGIAFFAHIGGFVAGLILTPFFRAKRR